MVWATFWAISITVPTETLDKSIKSWHCELLLRMAKVNKRCPKQELSLKKVLEFFMRPAFSV
jgi:hypothetical protein